MKTVREKLQGRIREVDSRLSELSRVPRGQRSVFWHESVDTQLAQRAELKVQLAAGFMVTDKRKVRR